LLFFSFDSLLSQQNRKSQISQISRTWTTTLAARLISEIVLRVIRIPVFVSVSVRYFGSSDASNVGARRSTANMLHATLRRLFGLFYPLPNLANRHPHTHTLTHSGGYYLSHTIRLCLLFQPGEVARLKTETAESPGRKTADQLNCRIARFLGQRFWAEESTLGFWFMGC